MIHFNDDTICEGIDPETLCGLSHKFVFNETNDEVYLKSYKSVDCSYCRQNLIRQGLIIRTRLELLRDI